MSGMLAILGSGETAPTMTKLHRLLLARAGDGPARMLESPFGFQENASEIAAKAGRYFADATGRTIETLPWRTPEDTLARDKALAAIRTSAWLLAGPGSPTYALRVWRDSGFAEEVVDLVRRGGVAAFSSAAALTLGSSTVPVYEVYKVGADPVWVPGLSMMEQLFGLKVAVIPHFDNSEGGGHDTRFCYLGERRMSLLEDELSAGEHVLGIDEHTALLLDLDTGTAKVWGNGVVTVRRHGQQQTLDVDTEIPIAELIEMLRSHGEPEPHDNSSSNGFTVISPIDTTTSTAPRIASSAPHIAADPVREAADAASAAFDIASEAHDMDGATAAVLELEETIAAWQADTTQSDSLPRARRTLRALIVRLGEIARVGAGDPAVKLAPFVELLLTRRAAARASKDFVASEEIRDGLAGVGVEVRDTPQGMTWQLNNV